MHWVRDTHNLYREEHLDKLSCHTFCKIRKQASIHCTLSTSEIQEGHGGTVSQSYLEIWWDLFIEQYLVSDSFFQVPMTLLFKSLWEQDIFPIIFKSTWHWDLILEITTKNTPKLMCLSDPTEEAEAVTLGVHGQCCWWPWVIRGPREWLLVTQQQKSCFICHHVPVWQPPASILSAFLVNSQGTQEANPGCSPLLIFDAAHMQLWHTLYYKFLLSDF